MHIRVWEDINLDLVAKHLLIVGDLKGDCANCRELGIDYVNNRICPNCKTEFKYMATRRSNSSEAGLIKRLKDKRPDLIFIDYNDFKNAFDRLKAKKFFSE